MVDLEEISDDLGRKIETNSFVLFNVDSIDVFVDNEGILNVVSHSKLSVNDENHDKWEACFKFNESVIQEGYSSKEISERIYNTILRDMRNVVNNAMIASMNGFLKPTNTIQPLADK